MRAQGLPINFIILAALALLVLIVVIAFFITGAGGFGAAITAQAAQTECRTRCNTVTNTMALSTNVSANMAISSSSFRTIADNFCSAKFNIRNQGDKYCDQIYSCVVTFADQTSCQLSCFSQDDPVAGTTANHTVRAC